MTVLQSFISIYITFGLALLFFSAYIFIVSSSDTMKDLEVRSFKLFILAFQIYVILVNLQMLQRFGAINISLRAYTAVCFGALFFVVLNTFFFYMVLVYHFDFGPVKSMRAIVLGFVPLLTVAFFLVASLFNGIVFKLDSNLVIVRGPMYVMVHACVALYFVFILKFAFSKSRKLGTIQAKKEAYSLLLLFAFLVLWTFLDNPLEGCTIVPVAIFAVIFHLFISSQRANIYTDTLTGMNNRRKAEIFLSSAVKSCSDEEPVYLFMGDINGFKSINDDYGHNEGDSALIIFSEAVKKSASAHDGFAARYGGDEFVWAWRPIKNGDVDPEIVINDIRHRVAAECKAQMKPYVLSLSIGNILCTDPKRSAASYLKEADKKMYADKRGHYRTAKQTETDI